MSLSCWCRFQPYLNAVMTIDLKVTNWSGAIVSVLIRTQSKQSLCAYILISVPLKLGVCATQIDLKQAKEWWPEIHLLWRFESTRKAIVPTIRKILLKGEMSTASSLFPPLVLLAWQIDHVFLKNASMHISTANQEWETAPRKKKRKEKTGKFLKLQ